MRPGYLVLALTASLLFFLYFYLSYRVITFRRRYKWPYLVNDDKAFIASFRAHANFNEYVPFGLILLGLANFLGMHIIPFTLLCLSFLIGRLTHAYSMIRHEPQLKFRGRVIGMALSFLSLISLALYNAIKALLLLL